MMGDKYRIDTPDEICERLRSYAFETRSAPNLPGGSYTKRIFHNPDGPEAADLIQQQQVTIEALVEALEELADGYRSEADPYSCGGFCRNLDEDDCMVTALAALSRARNGGVKE